MLSTRRARGSDQAAISSLMARSGGTRKYRQRYGANFNLLNLVEHGYVALVTCDESRTSEEDGGVGCFVVVSDGPRAGTAEEWLERYGASVSEKAPTTEASACTSNCGWVEFCVAQEGEIGRHLVEMTLREACALVPEMDHLFLEGDPAPELASVFEKALDCSPNGSPRYCARTWIVPTLMVREARVEDSDDLMPVFERQSEILAKNFGEFFLAEMIQAQDADNKAVVAVKDDRAVGLLAITTELDMPLLRRCFHLDPYDNLAKGQAPGDGGPKKDAREDATSSVDRAYEEQTTTAIGVGSPPEESSALVRVEDSANAFALTLFCLDEEYASRARDFFELAFSLYPDREYCVLTAPTELPTETHLLRLFTPVPARLESTFPHALFLLHREALSASRKLSVERFDPALHAAGAQLLEASHLPEAADEMRDAPLSENPSEACFAAVIRGQVVGVASFSRADCSTDALNWLKANYQVEDHLPLERHRARAQAVLTGFVLNPIFASNAKFVLKECARKYDKTLLYHLGSPSSDVPEAVTSHFVPIRARWRPDPAPTDAERDPRARDFESTFDAASASARENGPDGSSSSNKVRGRTLHYLTRRLVTERRRTVNTRIVVVGAATCALAAVSDLVLDPALNCVHVTVVDERGFYPDVDEPEQSTAKTTPVDVDVPDAFELQALGLVHRVSVVKAGVTGIDRSNKTVTLPDGGVVPFDVLVLAPSLSDATEHRLCGGHRAKMGPPNDALTVACTRVETLAGRDFFLLGATTPLLADDEKTTDPPPALLPSPEPDLTGLLSVASSPAAEILDRAVLACADGLGVVVTGGGLEALAAVEGLLAAGVRPGTVTLVAPGDTLESLGDFAVDRAVQSGLQAAGVAVEFGLVASGLAHDDRGALVAARFVSAETEKKTTTTLKTDVRELPCSLVLGAEGAEVPRALFRAIDEAGLVYDGRLVVDASFRTSDRNVYAAGPIAKFSETTKNALALRQRLGGGPTALYHDKANQLEVGAALAAALLRRLDPERGISQPDVDQEPFSSSVLETGGRSLKALLAPDSKEHVGARATVATYADDDGDEPLPTFHAPRTVAASLPGGLRYARSTLPRSVPHPGCKRLPTGLLGATDDEAGRLGVARGDAESPTTNAATGATDESPALSSGVKGLRDMALARRKVSVLRLDPHGVACDLVYVGRDPVEPRNLGLLVGLHESYLNQAASSYDRGLVDDWIDFFRQDWASALRFDRFKDLHASLARILASDEAARAVLDAVLAALAQGRDLDAVAELRAEAIGQAGANLPQATRDLFYHAVVAYLRKHRVLLPRFHLPDRDRASQSAGFATLPSGGREEETTPGV